MSECRRAGGKPTSPDVLHILAVSDLFTCQRTRSIQPSPFSSGRLSQTITATLVTAIVSATNSLVPSVGSRIISWRNRVSMGVIKILFTSHFGSGAFRSGASSRTANLWLHSPRSASEYRGGSAVGALIPVPWNDRQSLLPGGSHGEMKRSRGRSGSM